MAAVSTWQNRIVRYGQEAPDRLLTHSSNFRRHPSEQQAALTAVLKKVGWVDEVIVNLRTSEAWGADRGKQTVIDGHLRIEQAITHNEPSVPVKYVDLTPDEERVILATFDPIGEMAETDAEMLAGLMRSVNTADTDVQALLTTIANEHAISLTLSTSETPPVPVVNAEPAPDAIFPSDNEFDIPTLDIALQADYVDTPVLVWGARARRNQYAKGTYVFYTDDARFESLWTDPRPLVYSGVPTAAEPNFTTTAQMPRALCLSQIYRKRWIARYWQSRGVRIFVDLNVTAKMRSDNLLGVPQGWKAYATRGYSDQIDNLEAEYNFATTHAGIAPLFLVYGGGKAIKSWCTEHGAVWIAEDMDRAKGLYAEHGNG